MTVKITQPYGIIYSHCINFDHEIVSIAHGTSNFTGKNHNHFCFCIVVSILKAHVHNVHTTYGKSLCFNMNLRH